MLGPMLLVFVDHLHGVIHVPVDPLQRDAEGVHAALETLQKIGGHELANASLATARGQPLDLVHIEVFGSL